MLLLVGLPPTAKNEILRLPLDLKNHIKQINKVDLMTEKTIEDREKNIKTLVGLGINGTQAKISLALARIGPSTISEISDSSAVARPDAYRAVIELEKQGLIERMVSTPTKYELLPLSDVLSTLIGRREIQSRELQEKSASLLKEYENLEDEQPADDSQFVLVPSGKAFSTRLQKLIENSRKSICIISCQKTLTQFLDSFQEIKRDKEKEVNIKIVTEKRRNNSLTKRVFSLQQSAHLEIRFVSILPPFSLVTFDEKEILLSTEAQSGSGSAPVVYSKNSSLVELSQSHFNDAWFSAVESPGLAFKRSKLQFDYLSANMLNGFAYCKMIFENGKPIDFVYLQINEAFERITGLKRWQVVGKRALKVVPGIERGLLEIYGRVSCSGKAEELEIFSKSLNLWLHLSVYSPVKGYFAVIFEDITERKKTVEALLIAQETLRINSEQRWATTLASIGDAVIATDTNGKINFMNKVAEEITCWTLNDALQKPISEVFKIINEYTRREVEDPVRKVLEKGMVVGLANRSVLIRKDGTEVPIDDSGAPIKGKDSKIIGVILVFRDITKRKKAEEVLSESAARLRAYVTASSDVVYRMNPDWSEMRQLHGQNFIPDTNEPDCSWMEKYIHPDDREHVMAVIKRAIETKRIFELEHRVIRVDSSVGWTFSRAIPLLR